MTAATKTRTTPISATSNDCGAELAGGCWSATSAVAGEGRPSMMETTILGELRTVTTDAGSSNHGELVAGDKECCTGHLGEFICGALLLRKEEQRLCARVRLRGRNKSFGSNQLDRMARM